MYFSTNLNMSFGRIMSFFYHKALRFCIWNFQLFSCLQIPQLLLPCSHLLDILDDLNIQKEGPYVTTTVYHFLSFFNPGQQKFQQGLKSPNLLNVTFKYITKCLYLHAFMHIIIIIK